MFLTESSTSQTVVESAEFTGEDVELSELTLEHTRDLHNLSISMIRLEHASIVKNEATLLTEGVKEFFTKVVNKIKEYWAKFVAWLKHMVDMLVNKVFGPRKKWLTDNKAKLVKASYGDAKVTLDEKLLASASKIGKLVEEGEKSAETLLKGVDAGSKIEDLRKAITQDGKESVASAVRKELLGDKTTEVTLDKSLVGKLIDIAETTFENAPKFAQFQKIAAATVTIAEAQAKLADKTDGKDKTANEKIKGIQAVGPLVSQLIGAAKSVNDRANSQAMSALVKALHSGPKAESAPVGDGKGDLLGQY
jgi:hypothetical protein